MNKGLEQKIRDRAHALWEESGRVHGRAEEHWQQAEREVRGAAAAPAKANQDDVAPKTPRKRGETSAPKKAGSASPSSAPSRRKKASSTS